MRPARVIERPNIASVEDCRRVAALNADDSAVVMARVEAAIWAKVDSGRVGFVTIDVDGHTERAVVCARDTLVASGWHAQILRDPHKESGDPTAAPWSLIVGPP